MRSFGKFAANKSVSDKVERKEINKNKRWNANSIVGKRMLSLSRCWNPDCFRPLVTQINWAYVILTPANSRKATKVWYRVMSRQCKKCESVYIDKICRKFNVKDHKRACELFFRNNCF